MHIPELRGPPACVAGLLFKFPLHFTDLNTARALIYGVHIARIKLFTTISLFPMHTKEEVKYRHRWNGSWSGESLVGYKDRGGVFEKLLECPRVWEPQFWENCPYPSHQSAVRRQKDMRKNEDVKQVGGITKRYCLLLGEINVPSFLRCI